MFELVSFVPYNWMSLINHNIIPKKRIKLANTPTPIHSFKINEFSELGIDLWIKRDDLTSNDLSGNKVRKLEFLLAHAIEESHDSIITIGGEQSNHCRATAAAARQLGLEPYLILRTKTPPNELSLTGNLLINRMVGSHIRTVLPEIYYQVGGNYLISKLSEELKASGKNPYCIPIGGSNVLGSFGYLVAVQEIISSYCHCNESICTCECPYQHIVFSCGSGGTAAGIAIGFRLAGVTSTKIHAVGVCDTPEEFYQTIGDIATEMGLDISSNGIGNPTEWIHLHQGKGNGYAVSTNEELQFLYNVSSTSGIILDSVYSGKAFYYFYQIVKNSPEIFKRGDKVLFIHTGGLFGLYGVEQQLRSLLPTNEYVKPLEI